MGCALSNSSTKTGTDQGFNQKQRQIAEAATKEYDKQCMPLILTGRRVQEKQLPLNACWEQPTGSPTHWIHRYTQRNLVGSLDGFGKQHSDGVVMRNWHYQKRVDFLNNQFAWKGLKSCLNWPLKTNEWCSFIERTVRPVGATCRSVSQTMGKRPGNLLVHYNRALFDYRNLMFDQFGPQLNPCDKWKSNADERAKNRYGILGWMMTSRRDCVKPGLKKFVSNSRKTTIRKPRSHRLRPRLYNECLPMNYAPNYQTLRLKTSLGQASILDGR